MKTVKEKAKQKFTIGMKKKLVVLFVLVLLAFVGLGARLIAITKNNGEEYEKKVLSQQRYDSKTIPFKRGKILDCKNSVLAYSEKVYNVILDSTAFLRDDSKYVEPTLSALKKYFGDKIDTAKLQTYAKDNPTSRYYILAKKLSYDEIRGFQELITPGNDNYDSDVQGIWFEDDYIRKYPNNTLASDVIGFTNKKENEGMYGLEEYYNDVLNGTVGREYGYLDDDLKLERTTIPAEDGNDIVTTIDAHLQEIVEKYLNVYNDEFKNNTHAGNGADNVGCIMMNVHTGEILAMASYPNFDLNNPWDTSKLVGMPEFISKKEDVTDEQGNVIKTIVKVEKAKDEKGNTVYISQDQVDEFNSSDDAEINELKMLNLKALWKNFCVSDTYEPGSVSKPFTVAIGIESGTITGNESYDCPGYYEVGGHKIHCHNKNGDGTLTVAESIERSCNVAMMKISHAIGIQTFSKLQRNFGFGLKTNIDLAGESRTDTLVKRAGGDDGLTPTDLATYSFGQSYNCTMIEMITAFSSLVNGGYLYEPHVVKKIVSSSGSTIKNIEPRLLRQTISESTSKKIVEYCNTVVTGEHGTGKTARPVGFMIGGKTGTAETVPRNKRDYVVSFMGYAPADNPEIAIYVVVDRPNYPVQDDAKRATYIVHNVLTEALPYLNYPMTEPISEKEQKELDEFKEKYDIISVEPVVEAATEASSEAQEEDSEANKEKTDEKDDKPKLDWESFDVDPATGYYINPNTGHLYDPDTGHEFGAGTMDELEGDDDSAESSSNN